MKEDANAKINLSLDVIRRRTDGYHDLRMIMLPLSLHDTLHVTLSDQDMFTCDDPSVPLDEHNLIWKALRYLRQQWGLQEHFTIHLEKRIPMEAGLAGGSADAGAIIRAAMKLANIQAPLEAVAQGAKQVGADVPFCVMNQSARVEGIGEKITVLQDACSFEILLVKPATGVSTKHAYQMLDFAQVIHPDIDAIEQCLLRDDYHSLCALLGNTLEYSAFLLNPQVKELKASLIKDGVDSALMSGSGSTVFAIDRDHQKLQRLQQYYQVQGYFSQLVQRKG